MSQKKTTSGIDAATLNARLLSGHRLLVTREKDRVISCIVEFFDEVVPVSLFNAYLADGIIESQLREIDEMKALIAELK